MSLEPLGHWESHIRSLYIYCTDQFIWILIIIIPYSYSYSLYLDSIYIYIQYINGNVYTHDHMIIQICTYLLYCKYTSNRYSVLNVVQMVLKL